MVRFLLENLPNHHIVGFDRKSYCSNTSNVEFVEGQYAGSFTFVFGDLCNDADMHHLFSLFGPSDNTLLDYVFHFAAETHVDQSFLDSLSFTMNNVVGTHKLLEFCKTKAPGLKRFIHVSTDEVYGSTSDNLPTGCVESCKLEPTNPYAATKAAAELLCFSYWKSFNFPVLITRSSNVYGPRQFPDKVIPKWILLLQQGFKLYESSIRFSFFSPFFLCLCMVMGVVNAIIFTSLMFYLPFFVSF